jgi:hypothetical protein
MNPITTSSGTSNETLPLVWEAGRDGAFFRIVAHAFSADFCLGASILLGSNDID